MMDAVNYKNGRKNQWRRTAWNEIAKHVKNKRDAVVLYLPGSTDLDRPEAIRRGFKPANLIAVERDRAVARKLRAQGVTTIVGSLNAVLASWPPDREVAVVVADLQSGYTFDVEVLSTLCTVHPALGNCCLLLNMQRGRDPLFVSEAADKINSADEAVELAVNEALEFTKEALQDYPAGFAERLMESRKARVREEHEMSFPWFDRKSRAMVAQHLFQLMGDSTVIRQLPPYRSSDKSPIFDSFIASWEDTAGWRQRIWAERPPGSWSKAHETCKSGVTAALAIRTRRLRGELQPRSM